MVFKGKNQEREPGDNILISIYSKVKQLSSKLSRWLITYTIGRLSLC